MANRPRIAQPLRIEDGGLDPIKVRLDALEDTTYAASSDTPITAAGGITVTRPIMRVVGSGGAVDITVDPQIAAGLDTQKVTIFGTNDTNTVKLDNGTGLALSASITLAKQDNITLIYNSTDAVWIEISKTTVA